MTEKKQPDPPAPPNPTALEIARNLEAFNAMIWKRIHTVESATDPGYPLSVLAVAATSNPDTSMLVYLRTVSSQIEGKKDGYLQALAMTRDLLLFCFQLDRDFGLGLSTLPLAMAQHPELLAKYGQGNGPHVEANPDGTRTVRDLVEDTPAGVEGGMGGKPH